METNYGFVFLECLVTAWLLYRFLFGTKVQLLYLMNVECEHKASGQRSERAY